MEVNQVKTLQIPKPDKSALSEASDGQSPATFKILESSSADGETISSPEKRCLSKPLMQKQVALTFQQAISPKILIVVKPRDTEVIESLIELIRYIQENTNDIYNEIVVEQWLLDKVGKHVQDDDMLKNYVHVVDLKNEEHIASIQYIITVGGDGTVLYACKFFHGNHVPPLITFSVGPLSYLCNFEFADYQQIIKNLFFQKFIGDVNIDPALELRMRLKIKDCTNLTKKVYQGGQLENYETIDIQDYHVLNEIVIDRGPSPYASQLEIYIDGSYFTTFIGDGIILSTPTGSTAYNMSAGGSIVQVNVPAILLTPLAPHSLSFRPLLLPDSSEIRIKKPDDGRSSCWANLDGATRFELLNGESITIQASHHPIAFVTNPGVQDLTYMWSQKLTKLLKWNTRPQMKAMRSKNDKGPKNIS